MWTVNCQMFKLDLEKAEEQRSNCQHPLDHRKSKRVPEKHLLLLYWLCQKPLTVWITTNCGNSSRDGNTRPPDPPLEKICMQVRKQQVRTGHGTTDWFQIGKGVCQGCLLSPCLFNLYAEYIMWNARLDEAQLESRLQGEVSTTSYMQMTPPVWQKAKRN